MFYFVQSMCVGRWNHLRTGLRGVLGNPIFKRNFSVNRRNILLLTLILLVSIGCSDKRPLSGKVTFSDNGEPLTKGAVFFTTPTFVAQGDLKKDGTYTVGSLDLDDGIPPGDYKVYIAGADDITYRNVGDRKVEVRKSLIDPKYRSSEESGLTFTVDGSTRTFNIEVDRAK